MTIPAEELSKFFHFPGNYTACGGDFQMARRGLNANPNMVPTSPWFIRNRPTFSGMQVSDASTYYTIVTLDASTGDVLGAVINYPYEEEVKILILKIFFFPFQGICFISNRDKCN
jgi:hypothetical protein